MGWPKGKPRPEGAGRKKGTPNKSTQDLFEKCRSKGIDVFEALLDIAINSPKEDNRLHALKDLANYLYPKRKALEHSGEINNPYAGMTLEELKAIGKKKLET